ncbi:Undecaprenyl-phosphate mannosyltransferase [Planctomycetes bacterium CA13]|uniref:Undecaprenyl-phosphate mannosyltransferase n=1 Tax=Novipirellula herctigrandis TaxID=2527986 RepID=A0A5C5YYI5_9BACT|nr:Undecaprenyl-phosphate mannosyltransferase [Planctomycetes bacterium CA13]
MVQQHVSSLSPASTATLSVIVPCYNEGATVESLLTRVRRELPDAQVIVVDDGSTDESASILARLTKPLQLEVIRHDSNAGKGAAVRSGLEVASGDWMVIQDADEEYDPADLATMFELAQSDQCSDGIVYGSRYLRTGKANGGMQSAYLAVRVIAWIQWMLFGKWLSDPLTCYKMLPNKLAGNLGLQSRGFELCTEINAKLLSAGKQITEIPISYQPRSYAEGKKIVANDFLRLIATSVRYRFVAPVSPAPTTDSENTSRKSNWVYIASRVLIGVLLLIAGFGKVFAAQPSLLGSFLVIPAGMVLAWGIVEIVTGWAALTLLPHRLLRQAITAMFSLFVVVLSINWFSGATQCQCLGGSGLPIAMMLVLDLLAISGLVYYRSAWDHRVFVAEGMTGDLAKNLKFAIPVLLIGASLWFGSVHSAFGYLSGRSLLVDSSDKFVGVLDADEKATATFRVRNASATPIRILGAKASCRCVALEDLPITIEPSQTEWIRVSMYGRSESGPQRESAFLICDDSTSGLTLNVTALVHPNPNAVNAIFP